MYIFLSSVKRFCSPDQILHMGPTKHNVMCKGKSAMAVILGHDDFLQQRGRSVLTPAETIEDKRIIDPEIKVVRMRSPLLSNIVGSKMNCVSFG